MYDDRLAEGIMLGQNSNGNNNAFGDSAWWIIILLIFGWGNGGFGRNGNNGSGAYDNYVLASDFATLQRQIDSGVASLERKGDAIQTGLCDGFYAMNTGMLNGFSGVQQTMCQGFNGVTTAVNNSGYETRDAINTLGYNLQNCCCTTQRAIDGVNYNMANNTCAITSAISNSTRDIIESQNANYRALHDEITSNKLEAKNERIAELTQQLQFANLTASQQSQNAYLLSELKPCPRPAYITCNPNAVYNACGCCGNGSNGF